VFVGIARRIARGWRSRRRAAAPVVSTNRARRGGSITEIASGSFEHVDAFA
jgi:hypothetical protein